MKKAIFTSLLILQATWLFPQNTRDSLTLEITQLIKESGIPGMGVCMISEQGTLYTQGFGFRDIEKQELYDSLTVQPIASISKTFIGMAVMKLVEEGKVNLDTDINTILPFKIINPRFPSAKITLLHLVTHTSSILETQKVDKGSYYILKRDATKADFPKGAYKYYKKYLKNKNIEYHSFIRSSLHMDGENFSSNVFGKYKPGEQYTYSNIGACVAAYIVELVSGQTFIEYTQEKIFEPLNMKNTAWKKEDINSSNVSQLYFQNGQKVPDYQLISFPAGGLHINSQDMGIYMTEIIKGYFGTGSLLKKENYQILLSNQINSENISKKKAIFWDINFEGNIGHDGGEIGTACNVIFSPTLRKSLFVMVNCSLYDNPALEKDYVNLLITLSKYLKSLD